MIKLKLCKTSDVAPRSILRVSLPKHPAFAVYNLDGAYFVTEDACTHGNGSLSEGMIEGEDVMCPIHGGTFDIRTGRATGIPCVIPLKCYPVEIDADEVCILLEE